MTDELKCPVCGDAFGNEGALATHEALTKDAPHLAQRSLASPEPPAPASPQAGEAKAGEADVKTPVLPVLPPVLASAGEAKAVEPILITLPPPPEVKPLLAEARAGEASPVQTASGSPTPKVEVPLEPFIAGGLAAVVNGFVLRGEGDGELSAQEVTGTGFPKAAEACLKLYFPTVAWDHPLVALFMSGAGLASLIASKKAKKADEKAKPPASPQAGEAKAGEAPPAPAAPPAKGGTGDAYWDAILTQAGGAAHDD